jgi:signal transduction histidine kinase
MSTPPRPYNLLIIDDEMEIVKALQRQFRRDYNVHTATSADEGYRIMTETPIQVIISDQRMPGISGSEFFGRVKTEYPDATRLLLTGYADIQGVIAAINDGNVYRYITKPWDPFELDTIVREAFQRYQLLVDNRQLMNDLREANALLEQRVRERTTELAEANERLQSAIETRDIFLGMAAHDLRTPLTAIRGFADLIANPRTPTEDRVEMVDAIRATTQDMLKLLNDLLDITAIESGKISIKPIAVPLTTFVERIYRLNRHIGDQKSIDLQCSVQKGVRQARFDPQRIQQVLDNLISNAFKYSNSGTTVVLDVYQDDENLVFTVTDQGQGIPESELEMIFSAFRKGTPRPTANEGSTGLGLTICKKIVELHGGTITAESKVGIGSRFSFTLPLS